MPDLIHSNSSSEPGLILHPKATNNASFDWYRLAGRAAPQLEPGVPARLYPSSSKPDRITAASQAPNRRVSATLPGFLSAGEGLCRKSSPLAVHQHSRPTVEQSTVEISPARILIHLNGHAAEELIDRGSMASVRLSQNFAKVRKILTTSTSITTDSSTFRDIIIPGRYRVSATLPGFLSAGEGLCRKSSPLAVHQHSRPTVEQSTVEISPARILIHLNGHAAEELIDGRRSKDCIRKKTTSISIIEHPAHFWSLGPIRGAQFLGRPGQVAV
ncbi:hypothetical protein B0H13DRAFT_1862153 [Mycena leptocephala]|nr:hypothetical protein B0H13DRAFT_1862153 [Mycena leptocephala]